jgi:hypothetical protein
MVHGAPGPIRRENTALRAVLIVMSQAATPEGGAVPLPSGPGATLRQIDFAFACGCEQVLVLGNAGAREVSLLSREARARGAVLRVVPDAHGLLGQLNATDELLVLSAGLVPESEEAVAPLVAGASVLVLSADIAIPAGFERIDRERAWAGAAIIPGALIERLAELPPDIDAPAALLRIALQAQVPQRRLPDTVLTSGRWAIAGGEDAAIVADGWRRDQLSRAQPHDLTGRLAQIILKRWPHRFAAQPQVVRSLYGSGVLLLLAAVALAWYGHPAVGLALLAPSALSSAMADRLARIAAGPFAKRTRRWPRAAVLPSALDAALLCCGAMAVGGGWLGRLFPPAVLLIALHGTSRSRRPRPLAVLSDRALLSLALALAAALGLAEAALMVLAIVFLTGDRVSGDRSRRSV